MFLLRKRFAAAIVAAMAVLGGAATLHVNAGVQEGKPASTAPQAAVVDVASVLTQTVTDWHDYSGRLEAVDRVEIRPLVSGTLTEVHFKDGSLVEQGDVLFTIDPRPYQAAVDQAKARLIAAQARAAYTASDLARGKRLLAENAMAKRDYEEKRNAAREAAANVQGAQAALDSAQLDLEHTRIVAPIAGRVSRAALTAGNVVQASDASAPLTSLVSVSTMYASFEVDEQSFLKFVNPARIASAAPVPLFLGLANEEGHPRPGRLASVDNRLDASSGTIRVRALFDNADGLLVPGLYARIRLGGGAPHEAILIDAKAVGTDQDKRFVVVVNALNKTAYREVSLGASQNGLRVVSRGLKAGERIVINGLQRIRPGDAVAPKMVSMVGSRSPVAALTGNPVLASAD
jgi:multidrug efflux system membrane fusion protein